MHFKGLLFEIPKLFWLLNVALMIANNSYNFFFFFKFYKEDLISNLMAY